MKRLSDSSTLAVIPEKFEQKPFEANRLGDRPDQMPHRLMMPMHYEKNYAYPLVVWLHGCEDDENQVRQVMPHVSLRNYVAIGPRGCVKKAGFYNEDATPDLGYFWPQTVSGICDAEHAVMQAVELASDRCNIHPDRVFVGGYRSGGTMAMRLALRMPQLFAGAFSVGAPLPRTHAPLLNIERARGLSLLFCQGDESSEYPESRLCEDLRLAHSAGMKVAIRQYPCGDELTTQMLGDIDGWLMEQVNAASTCRESNA